MRQSMVETGQAEVEKLKELIRQSPYVWSDHPTANGYFLGYTRSMAALEWVAELRKRCPSPSGVSLDTPQQVSRYPTVYMPPESCVVVGVDLLTHKFYVGCPRDPDREFDTLEAAVAYAELTR